MESWRQAGFRPHGAAAAIDLGNEPPLGLDLADEEPVDPRRISIRWLAATVLTALSGASLMSGAVYAALDGEYRFASLPEIARLALKSAGDRLSNTTSKADRISLLGEHALARQIIRVSTTTKSGDREIVRVRPFVRVATNLTLTPSTFAADVPPFNPVKLMAEADTDERPEDIPQVEPSGDLSIVMRDLAIVPANAHIVGTLRPEDVMMKLRETIEADKADGSSLARTTIGGVFSGRLAYAVEGARLGTDDIPATFENMNSFGKTSAGVTGGNGWSERTVVVKKGDSLGSILRDVGTEQRTQSAIVYAFGPRGKDGGLKEGQRVRLLLQAGEGGQPQPLRVSIFSDQGHEGTVAVTDNGRYVAVAEPRDMGFAAIGYDDEDNGKGMRLYQSIYETALKNEIPKGMIENMIRNFSFDVDLQRRVRAGDSFDVLYANDEGDGNDVLYASLVTGGETRRYYRFQTGDDGIIDFYDEDGKSAKKFLVRKPMAAGVFTSGFGARNHPILGYVRAHTGVDWSDDIGAPIFAAGNGVIVLAEWNSGGYGRRIEVQHLNGYMTTYSHLSGFARGIEPGVKVRQGQVIGYVGSTGLSTGPHLHYEVLINGSFVDPMRVKLPRGRELDGSILGAFERERARIDGILDRSPGPRVSQTSAR
ncbi:MAG TPA: M23 family metallopeptidase [Xanthobacteraceae bacterium]|nr:M23 family metallopeptidase [Xanthobacteraceae bacterium]